MRAATVLAIFASTALAANTTITAVDCKTVYTSAAASTYKPAPGVNGSATAVGGGSGSSGSSVTGAVGGGAGTATPPSPTASPVAISQAGAEQLGASAGLAGIIAAVAYFL